MMANHREFLEANGINYSEALDRFAGNGALYERLALKFLDDNHVENLTAALDAGDAERAYREAHTLKGVAGNLSFTQLYLTTCEMSDALKEDDVTKACAILARLQEAYKLVMGALNHIRP